MGDALPIDWEQFHPLGAALHSLQLRGVFYCRSELTDPWGLSMPQTPGCMWFHAVTAGRCTVEVGDAEPLEVGPGDFLLVPHGAGHVLHTDGRVSTPDVTTIPHAIEEDRYALLRYGGGGALTTLVCGVVRLADPAAQDLVAALPPCIHLNALASPHTQWMQSTLQLMAVESRQLATGGDTIVTRLADILVVQALRTWLRDEANTNDGWLAALRDPQLGRALAAVHRSPQEDWTVASLAGVAGMSRAAFSARFSAKVGETPLRYVTRARMRIAANLLERDDLGVGEVAQRVGYQSEAAFSRAFKRHAGMTPGAARRRGSTHG